ncbi:MAG: V-type ATP synthase subunit E [Lachnospiraceae bacterium]|nr:V-type ATP synthase subunit E [Lachnospiraceae bacterium]
MAGIDNITGRILQEAQGEVEKILQNARNEAEKIAGKAGVEAAAVTNAAAARSEQQTKLYAARIKSSAESTRKKAILAAKQEIIDGVIDQAYDKLMKQDDASYFDMMQKILAKAVRPEKGVIALPAADLARVPESFKKAAFKIAADKGGELAFADAPAKIDSGFILSYGGIEENCSLKSIFAANRDRIQDAICKVLFS